MAVLLVERSRMRIQPPCRISRQLLNGGLGFSGETDDPAGWACRRCHAARPSHPLWTSSCRETPSSLV